MAKRLSSTSLGSTTTKLAPALSGQIDKNTSDIMMLQEELDDLEEELSAGVAMGLAMGNIPQLVGDQTFSVGVGVGFFNSEVAGSIGVNVRLSDNATGRASLAAGGSEVGGGAGVSFSW